MGQRVMGSITAINLLFITAIIIVSGMIIYNTIQIQKVETEKRIVEERKKAFDECVLDANREYTQTIKTKGTPMTISGKQMSGLSTEAWQAIEDQRKLDVAECEANK